MHVSCYRSIQVTALADGFGSIFREEMIIFGRKVRPSSATATLGVAGSSVAGRERGSLFATACLILLVTPSSFRWAGGHAPPYVGAYFVYFRRISGNRNR